jgi:hypothetical protein
VRESGGRGLGRARLGQRAGRSTTRHRSLSKGEWLARCPTVDNQFALWVCLATKIIAARASLPPLTAMLPVAETGDGLPRAGSVLIVFQEYSHWVDGERHGHGCGSLPRHCGFVACRLAFGHSHDGAGSLSRHRVWRVSLGVQGFQSTVSRRHRKRSTFAQPYAKMGLIILRESRLP